MGRKKRRSKRKEGLRWQWIVVAGVLLFFSVLEAVVIFNLYRENRALKAELRKNKASASASLKITQQKPKSRPAKKSAVLPKKKKASQKPKPKKTRIKPVIPKKRKSVEKPRPQLAIVLDDWGYSNRNFHYLDEVKECFDISVFPKHQYTKEAAVYAHSRGKEVMLHLPMEPKNLAPEHWEKNTITTDMDWGQIRAITAASIDSVPYVRGANNHMGSKATESEYVMQAVLSVFKEKGLFWIDSVSTADSQASNIAKALGVRFAKRDVFIDNENDIDYIKMQLNKAADIASSKGYAIAIGHDRPNTLEAIKQALPDIKARGIDIVCVSRLVK